jgi:nitrate/nitrite transporter NarK
MIFFTRLFIFLIACIFGLLGVGLMAVFMPYLTETLGMREEVAAVSMIVVFLIAVIFIVIVMDRD